MRILQFDKEENRSYSFRVLALNARAISGNFDNNAEYFSHNL
jgi:hypothetical protein